MKLKLYFILFALLGGVTLQSCDKDNDDDLNSVSPELQKALVEKYPGATRVEWEIEAGYYVADFYDNGNETSAWFLSDGTWHRTEIDILYTALPELVQASIQRDFSDWRVDDVDQIEQRDVENVYIIEVDKGKQEKYLRYSPEGILITK